MKTRRSKWPLKRQATKLLLRLSVCLVVCILACASCVLGETTADGASGGAVRRKLPPPPRFTEEGFEVKRVGSRYEPVVDDVRKDMVFRLPGTNMTFAAYAYMIRGDDMPTPRYGFLLDDGRFYIIDALDEPVTDARYGLTGDYFIVDGFAFGSSHNSSMYLFKYGKDSVKLCDMTGDPFIADHQFIFTSDYPGEPAYGHKATIYGTDKTPVWTIRDKDDRGRPLIRINVHLDFPSPDLAGFYNEKGLDLGDYEDFDIYFRIVAPPDNGAPEEGTAVLQLALDPEIYRPLFDSVRDVREAGVRPAAYYIHGFLAGQLDLPGIAAELANIEGRRYIVDILKDVDKWDAAFHRHSDEPLPKIVEYKLERR